MADQGALLGVDDVIITDELDRRLSRAPDYGIENRILTRLAETLASDPENLLQDLTDQLVAIGLGDSAGVSLDESVGEARLFRWVAASGQWLGFKGNTMPFAASPCGVVVTRNETLLFQNPERAFPAANVDPLIGEVLLVPFPFGGKPAGTIWAIKHRLDGRFDAEDARMLSAVSGFASAAYRTMKSQAEVRESEERFRALVNATSSAVYRMSPDWAEMRQLDGAGFIVDAETPMVDWINTYIPADERPRVREAIERAISAKDVFELEHRLMRADGSVGWTSSRAIPLLDDAGEIVEWFGVASDVTARVKADQSFTRLFEASPAPFLVLAPDPPRFTITEVNDAYLAATMRTREDLVGRALFDAFPDNPDDPTSTAVSNLRASLERVLASRRPDQLPGLKYDIARPDGTFEERWWSPVNSPILNDNGEVEAIIHNANDVTEERRAEAALRNSKRHQGLLLAELQHRVRNILTMVRSVARRTADNCEDVDDYVRHLDGRLGALARVQAILTRDPAQGVNLHDMVHDELTSQAALPAQYLIEGPEVELSPKAAEVLSLAVHELATNSTKYGVLSESRGTIQIRWTVDTRDGQAWLRWSWNEPVGSSTARPVRTGFGTELIVRRVPYELRGTGEMRIGNDEVEATIDFPLAHGERGPVSVAAEKDIAQ